MSTAIDYYATDTPPDYDWVAVDRALAGRAKVRARADKLELVRRLVAAGATTTHIARTLGCFGGIRRTHLSTRRRSNDAIMGEIHTHHGSIRILLRLIEPRVH